MVMDLILGNETGHHSRNINPSSALGGCISAFEKNKWPPPALIGLAIFTFIAILVHPDGLTWIICRQIRYVCTCITISYIHDSKTNLFSSFTLP